MDNIIEKLTFEFDLSSSDESFEAEASLDSLYDKLLKELDDVFNTTIPDNEILLIEKLEIDLDFANIANFKTDLIAKIKTLLSSKISSTTRESVQYLEQNGIDKKTTASLKLDILKEFIRDGFVDSLHELPTGSEIENIFTEVIQSKDNLKEILRLIESNPSYRNRIFMQISSRNIAEMIRLIYKHGISPSIELLKWILQKYINDEQKSTFFIQQSKALAETEKSFLYIIEKAYEKQLIIKKEYEILKRKIQENPIERRGVVSPENTITKKENEGIQIQKIVKADTDKSESLEDTVIQKNKSKDKIEENEVAKKKDIEGIEIIQKNRSTTKLNEDSNEVNEITKTNNVQDVETSKKDAIVVERNDESKQDESNNIISPKADDKKKEKEEQEIIISKENLNEPENIEEIKKDLEKDQKEDADSEIIFNKRENEISIIKKNEKDQEENPEQIAKEKTTENEIIKPENIIQDKKRPESENTIQEKNITETENIIKEEKDAEAKNIIQDENMLKSKDLNQDKIKSDSKKITLKEKKETANIEQESKDASIENQELKDHQITKDIIERKKEKEEQKEKNMSYEENMKNEENIKNRESIVERKNETNFEQESNNIYSFENINNTNFEVKIDDENFENFMRTIGIRLQGKETEKIKIINNLLSNNFDVIINKIQQNKLKIISEYAVVFYGIELSVIHKILKSKQKENIINYYNILRFVFLEKPRILGLLNLSTLLYAKEKGKSVKGIYLYMSDFLEQAYRYGEISLSTFNELITNTLDSKGAGSSQEEEIKNVILVKERDSKKKGGYLKKLDKIQKQEKKSVAYKKIGDGIYVHNAGAILLWPFLSRFFSMTGLFKKGKKEFLNHEARYKAVFLIEYLVTKRISAPENELILNKVLCGIPVDIPIPSEVEFSQEEKDMAESLLKAVVGQWKATKNTSPDSLRGGFLIREGKLTNVGGEWNLVVEQKTLDILIKKLPWSFSMIKLPWLNKLIRVEW